MKFLMAWVRGLINRKDTDLAKLNEDIALLFTSDRGKRVLRYLIHEHMMNFPHDHNLTQMIVGRQIVIQDILARMDLHYSPRAMDEMKVEEGEFVI